MENQKFKIIPSYLLNTIVQVPIEYKSPSKNNKQTKLKTDKKNPKTSKYHLYIYQIVKTSSCHGAYL